MLGYRRPLANTARLMFRTDPVLALGYVARNKLTPIFNIPQDGLFE